MSEELTSYPCRAGLPQWCTAYVERRVSDLGIYLCHEHMLLAWATVQKWLADEAWATQALHRT